MKILVPVNNLKEIKTLIRAGADAFYCGVLSREWANLYTNVASSNRREWSSANLSSFDALKEVVYIAHEHNVPVYFTVNALYTKAQYPLVYEQLEGSRRTGVDAFIVADVGLLLNMRRRYPDLEIHISTGGTVFNSRSVTFYEEFGICRIILPRHLLISEIKEIVSKCPTIKFEVFILNSGCKNIDGFCTFHHGIHELMHRWLWNVPKKFNIDRHFLNLIRGLPKKISCRVKADIFGVDSACLLNYKIAFTRELLALNKKTRGVILKNISFNFGLLTGVDPCGACRLLELKEAGVYAVKIVGRNYSTEKKIKDVQFLKAVLLYLESQSLDKEKFRTYVKDTFRKIYKINCGGLCYYPLEM